MTDETPTLRIGMTLAEMDEHFNPGRKEAHERRMAEHRALIEQEIERVQARGVELRRQYNQFILDHMPIPEQPS